MVGAIDRGGTEIAVGIVNLVRFAFLCRVGRSGPNLGGGLDRTSASLTLKSHSPFAIWMGGTLAMASKGGLAMVLGVKLRDRLPQRKLQALASMSCCVLGALTLARLVFGRS